MKAMSGVVLVKAGVEDSGDAEALVFRRQAERRELALGAGEKDAVANLRADLSRRGRCRGRWAARARQPRRGWVVSPSLE